MTTANFKPTLLLPVALILSVIGNNASACFKSGESTSGMNKICYYDCVSGKKAITISATSLCPLSLYKSMDIEGVSDDTVVSAEAQASKVLVTAGVNLECSKAMFRQSLEAEKSETQV